MTLVTKIIIVASLVLSSIGIEQLSYEDKMVVKERMNSEALERKITETSR